MTDRSAFRSEFAKTLKRVRERALLSQAELADRSAVSAEFISRMERGLAMPSLNTLMRLSEATNSTPSAFFESEAREAPTMAQIELRLGRVSPEVRRKVIRAMEARVRGPRVEAIALDIHPDRCS